MNHPHRILHGTSGDDVINSSRGGVFAMGGNDTINATVSDDRSQIHSYGDAGNDVTNLNFNKIEGFAHGHHARGGEGSDIFNFTNIGNVSGFVSGRIEDFDIRTDEIRVEGKALDFNDLPDNVRVVSFNGHHDDPGSNPQPYIHISTSAGGDIFYALEGARVDMDQPDIQEPHFLSGTIDPWALEEIDYSSPNNYLPDDHGPVSGLAINDLDVVRADVLEEIHGSIRDDLIAAGLNDDTVRSGAGDDSIWGGNGNDVVHAGPGNDWVDGSTGNDHLLGGHGLDTILGGNGNDLIDGGSGRDDLSGGEGGDMFAFSDFNHGFDLIRDFSQGEDRLGINSRDIPNFENLHLVSYSFEGEPSTLIRFLGTDGEIDRSLGGVVLKGILPADLGERDFEFGEPDFIEDQQPDNDPLTLGTDGSDATFGSELSDLIFGVRGDDTIDAGGGNDLINGGEGRDDLTGGDGNDKFDFTDLDRGFDVIRDFSQGEDQIVFDHQDVLILEDLRFVQYDFEDEPSTLIRFLGDDGAIDKSLGGIVLKGVAPTDLSEEDFHFGEPQIEDSQQGDNEAQILGSDDDDSILGTEQSDHLEAGNGDDTVDGGGGDDLIDGGKGHDDLSGGEGEDAFAISDFDHGFDVIRDFSLGEDQVVFDHPDVLILEDLRFVQYSFEDEPSTLIRFLGDDGEIDKSLGGIVLKGVALTDLAENHFEFGGPAMPDEGTGEFAAPSDGTELMEALYDAFESSNADPTSTFQDDGGDHLDDEFFV